jgi:hypothetical protein
MELPVFNAAFKTVPIVPQKMYAKIAQMVIL